MTLPTVMDYISEASDSPLYTFCNNNNIIILLLPSSAGTLKRGPIETCERGQNEDMKEWYEYQIMVEERSEEEIDRC